MGQYAQANVVPAAAASPAAASLGVATLIGTNQINAALSSHHLSGYTSQAAIRRVQYVQYCLDPSSFVFQSLVSNSPVVKSPVVTCKSPVFEFPVFTELCLYTSPLVRVCMCCLIHVLALLSVSQSSHYDI